MQYPDENADRDAGRNDDSESHSPPIRPEVRYELSDVSFRGVLIVAVAGCLIGATLFLLVRVFFWTTLESVAARQATPSASMETQSDQLPTGPRLEQLDRLEGTPPSNVVTWEAANEQLESYGPGDEKGFVRIPLQRALQTVAAHLPVRKKDDQHEKARAAAKDNGLVDGGESNSGRMFRSHAPHGRATTGGAAQ